MPQAMATRTARYQPSYETRLRDQQRALRSVGREDQQASVRAAQTAALRLRAATLRQSGELPDSLPAITDNMSDADRLQAARQMGMSHAEDGSLVSSTTPEKARAAAIDTVAAEPAVTRNGAGFSTVVPRGTGPHSFGPRSVQFNPSIDDLLSSGEVTPASLAANAQAARTLRSPINAPTAPAAPVVTQTPDGGRTIAGQYGTGSATPGVVRVTAGNTYDPNPATPALNWQQQIVAKYPQVGVAGSPENKAFVEQYLTHKDPAQAMGTADTLFAPKEPNVADLNGDATPPTPAVITPPNDLSDVSAGTKVGQAVRGAAEAVIGAPKKAASAIDSGLGSAANFASDIYSGITGQPKVTIDNPNLAQKALGFTSNALDDMMASPGNSVAQYIGSQGSTPGPVGAVSGNNVPWYAAPDAASSTGTAYQNAPRPPVPQPSTSPVASTIDQPGQATPQPVPAQTTAGSTPVGMPVYDEDEEGNLTNRRKATAIDQL